MGADQLRQVSEGLEALTETHVGVGELLSVAGNIRSIAAVLDVFTLIRSNAGGSENSVLVPPTNDYLNCVPPSPQPRWKLSGAKATTPRPRTFAIAQALPILL